jgi:hypothetical protein
MPIPVNERGLSKPSKNGSRLQAIGKLCDGFGKDDSGYRALCPSHDDREPSLSINEGRDGRILVYCHVGCRTEDVLSVVGLRIADLMPGASFVVDHYDYQDEQGDLLYQVGRNFPKGFRQRAPNGDGWTWSTKDVRRVLYRLPELRANADRLALLGLTATTNVGGAGKWKREYSEAPRGRHVVILPDNDEPGRAHAQDVASNLQGVAASVKLRTSSRSEAPNLADYARTIGLV